MAGRKSQFPWWFKYIKSRANETWGWCPERKKAKARATIGRDLRGNELFRCEKCDAKPLGRKEVEIDHIVSRVPPTGWDGFDGYLNRTFVPAEGLQVLCKACHHPKSASENESRRKARKATK